MPSFSAATAERESFFAFATRQCAFSQLPSCRSINTARQESVVYVSRHFDISDCEVIQVIHGKKSKLSFLVEIFLNHLRITELLENRLIDRLN